MIRSVCSQFQNAVKNEGPNVLRIYKTEVSQFTVELSKVEFYMGEDRYKVGSVELTSQIWGEEKLSRILMFGIPLVPKI